MSSAALRPVTAREIGRPTLRSLRWQLVPLAALVAGGLLVWQRDGLADPVRQVWVLRAVAALLATAVVGAVGEPARALVAPLPVPLWWRATLRLVVVAGPAVVLWTGALTWVAGRSASDVPAGALSVEAAALLAVGLALASGLGRWRDVEDPGVVAGPAVLCLGLLLGQLPARLALLVPPGPGWAAAHQRWAVLLVAAVLVLVASLRDPARRSPTASWRRASPDSASSCVRG